MTFTAYRPILKKDPPGTFCLGAESSEYLGAGGAEGVRYGEGGFMAPSLPSFKR